MTSASIAQVASATAALCGAAGVTYYAVNVAKVFGGARRGEGDANGRARASRRSVAVDDDEGVGRRDEGAHEGVAARGERDARRAGTDG